MVANRLRGPASLLRQQLEVERQRELPLNAAGEYRMWEDPASPYSAKVRSYLRYKGIPYRRMRTNFTAYFEEIPRLVGVSMIPVVLTPDDRVMLDSTPILLWLEGRHPEPSILPPDPALAVLARLIEDFSDEYVLRLSMHLRWGNDLTRATLSARLARSLAYGVPEADVRGWTELMLARQSGFDEQLGITDATRPDLELQAHELVELLDTHFSHASFLLGDRPSLADFGLYGQLYAHFFSDPYPASILETKAPQVCFWIERITDLGDSRGGVGLREFGDWLDLDGGPPDSLLKLLEFIAGTYVPMSAACSAASVQRRKSYTVPIRGIETTFGTHHYRAWAFECVQQSYLALSEEDRTRIDPLLTKTGVLPGLMAEGVHHNGLYDGRSPPFVEDGAADNRIRHLQERR